MALKASTVAVIGIGLFVLILASVLLVPFWHLFPAVAFSSTSFFLEEYSVKAYDGEQACLKLNFHVPENVLLKSIDLRVFNEGNSLFFERLDVKEKDFLKTVCFDSSSLSNGDNRIEVFAMGKNLFFHVEKISGSRPFGTTTSIDGISLSRENIAFTVNNFDTSYYKPVEIWVNGKLDHAVYPERETQSFNESIELQPGSNNVSIFFNGESTNLDYENPSFPQLPFPLGLALLIISFLVFGCGLFPNKSLIEKIGLSFALVFLLIIILVFVLNYTGLLNFYSLTGSFVAITLLFIVLFRKNLALAFSKTSISKPSLLVLIAIALFFIMPVIFHMFSFTDITYWNKFYERQSNLILEENSIPTWDNLAYFGRTYSFSPGYFLLEAGIGWITGLRFDALFSLVLVLANMFLFFSVFYLGKALELNDKRIALFALFVAMSGFLLSAMSYSPRHVFAFAFFLVALAFTLKHDNPVVTGLLLAAMAFIQFPLILFFPLFYVLIAKKIHLKRIAKAFSFGLLFVLLLMLPNLILYGLPFQASPEDWGYLIDYSLYYWFIDIVALLAFFVLFSLFDLVKGFFKKDFYTKKLFVGFVLGTLIQLFIIYRWNILTTTTLALLIAILFPEKSLKNPTVERLLSILALVAFGFLLFGMSYLNVHEIVTTPVSFIEERTSSDARVLADPMFGHDITSVAERPVLADLRVEYADGEKLDDAYYFLEERDYAILQKYGITQVFNQVDYIHRQAIGGEPKYGKIEFPELDKIYSNGFIFVHRVPLTWKENN